MKSSMIWDRKKELLKLVHFLVKKKKKQKTKKKLEKESTFLGMRIIQDAGCKRPNISLRGYHFFSKSFYT